MAATAYYRRKKRPYRDRLAGDAWTWDRDRYDEVKVYDLDISELLETNERCYGVTAEDRYGVTVPSITITAAGVLKVKVSAGSEGGLKAKISTSRAPVTLEEYITAFTSLQNVYNAHVRDRTFHEVVPSASSNDSAQNLLQLIAAFAGANALKAEFNTHKADAVSHSGAGTAEITASDATNLATLCTLLNEAKTDINAHNAESIHPTADGTNTVTAADATTQATAITLLYDCVDKFCAHECDTTGFHRRRPSISAWDFSDFPLDQLNGISELGNACDLFRTAFDLHRIDGTAGHASNFAHDIDDDDNDITYTTTPTTMALLSTAYQDCLTQYLAHIQDEDSGYHLNAPDTVNLPAATNGRTLTVPLQWRRTDVVGITDAYR